MELTRFEESIRTIVPEFILKQFSHLLPAVPERHRHQFIDLLRMSGDMTGALKWVASSAGAGNKPVREYLQQRTRDNMTEIMD